MGIEHYSDEQLKSELKGRRQKRRKDPLWVRQPLWWRSLEIIFAFYAGFCLTVLAPIWAPFYFAYKIHKEEQKDREKATKEQGFDWNKYH